MAEYERRRALRKASRALGPVNLLVGLGLAMLKLIGFAGTPDDANRLAKWLDDPDVLKAILILSGAVLTYVGYQDLFRTLWYGAVFTFKCRYPSESAERRIDRVRGLIDGLIHRGRWMLAIEEGKISSLMRTQWAGHARKLIRRSVVDAKAGRELGAFSRGVGEDEALEEILSSPDEDYVGGTLIETGIGYLADLRERLDAETVRLD